MHGGDGNDTLTGGDGNDALYGGSRRRPDPRSARQRHHGRRAGRRYVLLRHRPRRPDNVDTILDFEVGVDKIALLPSIFGAIGTSLSKGEFFLGNKAHDKNDHIIYNEKNGKLFYDDDGKGGDAKVQIATLDKHLDLTHHDFQLIEI